MSASRRAGAAWFDPIPAAWGGLVGAIGVMVGGGHSMPIRLSIAVVAYALGGFLAGVRAGTRRLPHALAGWVVSIAIALAFVLLSAAAHVFGADSEAELLPGGAGATLTTLAVGLAGCAAGGLLAHRWLRPKARRRRY
ncbi:MAG: hypothetical protein U0Y82_03540 [Thermoleophilia bacterium]